MEDIKIVIGASFGDEGKGLMTDYFAADVLASGKNCLVVCSNGGAQRGHTVRARGKLNNAGERAEVRHVFHHFGSGSLAGADTYLPYYFILNPIVFMNEYFELQDELQKLNDNETTPVVYISPECYVSTPFDMILNQMLEEHRGNGRHGSCGMGIWETLVRSGKNFGEMAEMSDAELAAYLKNDCKTHFWKRLEKMGVTDFRKEWKDIIGDEGLVQNYIQDFRDMQKICITRDIDVLGEYDRVIFENGQGLLLDRCRREYGHNTTPSNTGFRNPAQLLREYKAWKERAQENETEQNALNAANKINVEVCYVTRTYLTRHGAGRFDEQCDKNDICPDMVDLTNVPNPHQGTMRYGLIDRAALLKRVREDFDSERLPQNFEKKWTLAVTHMNEYISEIAADADYLSDGETREDVIRICNKASLNVDATYYQNYNMKT